MSDNWQNRAAVMRCDNCMAFVPKLSGDGIVRLGRCRRHAPTMGGFPAVFPSDWCFDHRLDENRIGTPAHVSAMASEVAAARAAVLRPADCWFVPRDVDSVSAQAYYCAGRDGVEFDSVHARAMIPVDIARQVFEAGQAGKTLVLSK